LSSDYAIIALMLAAGIGFGAVLLIAAWVFRVGGFLWKAKGGRSIRRSTYECGMETIGTAWVQIRVSFYLFAILFVVFDVETVFLYPWAVAYRQLGLFALVEMLIFVAILMMGLVYAWRKGALEWK
jgi:NADH:ubiquinone oxidoreductase subunit 3 (subunit A)